MKSILEKNSLFAIYKSFFDFNEDACYALDLEGNFILFNDAASRMTGYTKEEILLKSFISFIPVNILSETIGNFNTIIEGKQGTISTLIKHKNGQLLEINLTALPIFIDGKVQGIAGFVKLVHEENLFLNGQYQVLDMVAKNVPFSEVLTHIISLVEKVSDNGICTVQLVDNNGKSLINGAAPSFPAEYMEIMDGTGIGPSVASWGKAAYYNRRIVVHDIAHDLLWRDYKDNALKHGLRACWSTPVCDHQQKVIAVFSMYYDHPRTPTEKEINRIENAINLTSLVIQHYRVEEKINFMVNHDETTGLPNRKCFDEKVKIAINLFKKNNDKMLAFMYFDLDRFKLINDSLGHHIGNMLLKQVARKLQNCMREKDIVSRSGSDEFIILLDNVSKQEISKIADRIQAMFVQSFVIEGHEIFVTPSIGISTFPLDGDKVDELIRKADVAMFQAKKEGRNNYKFYNSIFDNKANNRLEIENELRKAMDRNEFILHYQPIMDLNENKMKGAEALIRWEHPQLGRVSPDKFIPIAEETGMIVPIGEWVLRTACQQLKNWQESGINLSTISVNISFRQFYQPNLVSMIDQIVKETGIDPKSLTIEITESMTMDVEEASQKLNHLKNIGVNISIDDFGTGYSSLSYLKKFPIDYLKIDQSFIRDIAKSKDDENIATTILLMGQNLGLSVIAEGVELKEQLEFLRRHDCNEAQGYLFSKPLPANELKELFRR